MAQTMVNKNGNLKQMSAGLIRDITHLQRRKDPAKTHGRATLESKKKLKSSDPALAEEHAGLIYAVARQQDRSAFASLFQYYAPRLKAFAMKGGISSEAAEEIMQESMVALWRKAGLFDHTKASASTWLFTIVRNKRIDFLRRGNKPTLTKEDFAHVETTTAGADEDLSTAQDHAKITKKLASLPKEQLSVIQKAFYEDKSHAEVAKDLGLPLGTVKSRIRLALKRLKGDLEKE